MHWNDLMEAKRPVVDHAARAQGVYDLTLKVAANLSKSHYDFRGGWDQTWAKMIQEGLKKARASHDAEQKEETAYYQEEGKTFTPIPFNVIEVLGDVTAKWWDQEAKDNAVQIERDAKWEYEDYQDGHPRVEQSDEMSALHDQLEMAKKIVYYGSDTIEGMTVILTALDNYAEDLNRYVSSWLPTRSAIEFIKKAFPAFMTICSYMGAKKA